MNKTYRDWSPNQAYMFPPSAQDWLPEDDLVYFLLDTVATLDLTPIFAHYERELRGQPPFHPRMMVALLLYCYATGTRSSRKIMRRCRTDVGCRIIVGDDIPDFRTISDFRKTHLTQLETLFVEVLKLCVLAGLVKVGTIALDGTKVKANASRHKAMSYERMQEEEKRLKEEVARLLAEAEATDASEDAAHGCDRSGEELPEELARRQSRLAKIQQAKAELEERARREAAEDAARRQAEGKAPPATDPADAVPQPKDQINFTDPEMYPLALRREVVLRPVAPFHFTGTMRKPSHFPAPIDRFRDGMFMFTIRRGPNLYGLQLRTHGRTNKGENLHMSVYAKGPVGRAETDALAQEVRYRFGMDMDLSGFMHMSRKDSLLARVEERAGEGCVQAALLSVRVALYHDRPPERPGFP